MDSKELAETSETGEESSTSETEEKTVPYSRFKEVNDKMRGLERDISSLKAAKSAGELSEEQQKELKAKEYLKGLLKETIEEQKKQTAEEEAKEQTLFEQEVEEALLANTDVKRAEFLKFIEEEGDDYSSVQAIMKGYKRLAETSKTASEKTKKELAGKPSLPTSEGGGGEKPAAETDKGKPLWQIAVEAAKELGLK